MTTFSQSALGMLRCAESALAGESTLAYQGRFADGGELPTSQACTPHTRSDSAAMNASDSAHVLLLAQQLQHAVREMAVLKAELAAEREGRSETLAALGKRWRESLLVEVRGGDHHLHRDVAEVEERVAAQLKADAAANAALRRQVDDLARRLAARDTSQFDAQERLHEELESLRRQVAETSALCTSVRVEAAREAEQERAALSRRLDVELLRYVDMRQEDQRELHKVRALVKDEVLRVGGQVREMVSEAWQTCATTLEKSVRGALADLERETTQNKHAVRDMHEAVAGCTRTVQAELRVHSATFKERLAALESNESVMLSRVDRAEKKSDAAHDGVSRLSAEVQSQRESLDRCVVAAQRASELATRVEATQLDRDARLTAVEQHLQATTTAEALRAEVEGCKRAVGRAESRVDALGAVCSRAEEAAERSARAVELALDRATQSTKAADKVSTLAQELSERVVHCEQRVGTVEGLKDEFTATAERHSLASARLDQRLASAESRLRLLGERHDQVMQDLTRTQEAHGARIEAAHGVASRSDAASAVAKAEVNRLEKRLVRLESGITTFTAECASLHTEVRDVDNILAQNRQLRDRLEASEALFTERAGSLEAMEANLTESMGKITSRVENQLTSLADHTQERLGQLEAQVREIAGKGDVERRITHRVNEWQTKVKEFVTDQYRNLKHRCEEIEGTVKNHENKFTELQGASVAERNLAGELQNMRNSMTHLQSFTQKRIAQCQQDVVTVQTSVRTLEVEFEGADGDNQMTSAHVHQLQTELDSSRTMIDQLRHDLEAAVAEQRETTRRALSAAESVAQRLAQSLEKPMTAPSTSSTMMAGHSTDVSSPSVHVTSAMRTSSPSRVPDRRPSQAAWAAPEATPQQHTAQQQAPQQQAPQQQAPQQLAPQQAPPLSAPASQGSSQARDGTSSDPPVTDPAQASPRAQSRSALSAISSVHPASDPQALCSGSSSVARSSSEAEAAVTVAPSAPAPLVVAEASALNTSGQRTVIQRFNALDDSSTDDAESRASDSRGVRPRRDDEATTEDVTTTTPTPPRPAPVPAAARPGHHHDKEETEEEEEDAYEEEEDSAATGPLHTSSQPVAHPAGSPRAANDWDDDDEEEEGSAVPEAAGTGAMTAGRDDDSDDSEDSEELVLPMSAAPRGVPSAAHSPSPARPAGALATSASAGTADRLQATPRKAFVHSSDDDDDPLRHEEVPTHGKSTTTSSSSGERRSASGAAGEGPSDAEGAEARPQPGTAPSSAVAARAQPSTGTRYTAFDDSEDDSDDA